MDDSENIRKKIHDLVEVYFNLTNFSNSKDNFEINQPKQTLKDDHAPVTGKMLFLQDFINLVDSSLDGWFTEGRFTKLFEKKIQERIKVRNSIFVNSGSSANLLAVSALSSKKMDNYKGNKKNKTKFNLENRKLNRLNPGDEIITTAACFPTTINPIIQNNFVPVLVDIEQKTYNVDIAKLKDSLTDKTKAIFLTHTLGNPFNLEEVVKICNEKNLFLIEDSCDAFGGTYGGFPLGSFGDISTLSFYPAHHITSGEGGSVQTDSPLIRTIIESFRDWGRDCYCETGKDDTCNKRFEWQMGELPLGYDHKFIYSEIGYNLKATDMQAALGSSQIENLELFKEKRKENFGYLSRGLNEINDIILPEEERNSNPSWFGLPITLKKDGVRTNLVKFLNANGIGTRLIFAGNIKKQPAYSHVRFKVPRSLEVTDNVMNNSFWIGVHPGLQKGNLDYVLSKFDQFFKNL
jgi:CDP-6-deoxy-D-xylo-4-hexulose-3-dehydrase